MEFISPSRNSGRGIVPAIGSAVMPGVALALKICFTSEIGAGYDDHRPIGHRRRRLRASRFRGLSSSGKGETS